MKKEHNMQNEDKQSEIDLANKTNCYKTYSLFNDVEDARLRAFNRTQTFYNIYDLHGKALAEDWSSCLTDQDRGAIFIMLVWLKKEFGGKFSMTSDDWQQAKVKLSNMFEGATG